MKREILAIVPLLLLPVAGQAQDVPLCDQHPAIDRSLAEKARQESRGLRSVFQESLRDRGDGGLQVDLTPSLGGGPCPDRITSRGQAAAAVGAILYSGQIHCSGVLIAPSTVITAAHCIDGFDRSRMEFMIGDNIDAPVQRAGVLRFGHHKDYDRGRFGVHDLAFLHLERRITEVQPVRFQQAPLKSQTESRVLHVGFGIGGSVPGVKRCVDIPVSATCDTAFTSEAPGMNTCNGDSGGGAFIESGGEVRLAGITSWGDSLCQKYGVSLDVGAYPQFLGAWMGLSEAEKLLAARIEPAFRRPANPATLEGIQTEMAKVPVWKQRRVFESHYKGQWVKVNARMLGFPEATPFPNACNVFLKKRDLNVLLLGLEHGCALWDGMDVEFMGRLSSYSDKFFEITDAELTQEIDPVAIAGTYRLVTVSEPQTITERRTQGFRLESHHGSSSTPVRNCHRMIIEGDWKIDRTVRPHVDIAYQNHGDFEEPRILSDQELCIPLYAEGFGGHILDAGNKGVISGSVSFTVYRIAKPADPVEVSSGTLSKGAPLAIPLPRAGEPYELRLHLQDGREIITRQSIQGNGIEIDWNAALGTIQVTVD
jgi:hypothetical protein